MSMTSAPPVLIWQSLPWCFKMCKLFKNWCFEPQSNILTQFLYFLCSVYTVCTPAVFNQWPSIKHNGFWVSVFTFCYRKQHRKSKMRSFWGNWKNSEETKKCLEAERIRKTTPWYIRMNACHGMMMMVVTMDIYFLTKLSFITIAFDQTVRSLFWQSQSWEYRHVVGEPIKGRNIHPSSNDTRSALCLAPGAHPSTGCKSNLPPSLPLPNNSSLLGWQWGASGLPEKNQHKQMVPAGHCQLGSGLWPEETTWSIHEGV